MIWIITSDHENGENPYTNPAYIHLDEEMVITQQKKWRKVVRTGEQRTDAHFATTIH